MSMYGIQRLVSWTVFRYACPDPVYSQLIVYDFLAGVNVILQIVLMGKDLNRLTVITISC